MSLSATGSLWRATPRVLLMLIYSVVVALIFLEIFLRLFDPIGIRYYFDGVRYFSAMRDDPDYGYIHPPEYNTRLQGVDVTTNREGLRMGEFDIDKRPDEKRLMILGDSLVFGWGVAQDSIFPARLEALLRAENEHWTVISAGVGSWNTRTEYEYFRARGIDFQPDRLVLVVVPNDVDPKPSGRTAVDRSRLDAETAVDPGIDRFVQKARRGLMRVSYVAAVAGHFLRRQDVSNRLVHLYDERSAAWEDARLALTGIVDLCRESGIDLFVFLYGDLASDFSKSFYKAYSAELDELGVVYSVLPPDIYDPRYRNSLIDAHPNAEGHRRIANEIFKVIEHRL